MTTTANPEGGVPPVATLLARASAETGLGDFGDEEFHDALTHLVDCINKDKLLNPIGVMAFNADVHRILINRLRFTSDLKRHPEILGEEVTDPIVIIGMPRTGTTKLQRLLSADPDVQRADYWRLFNVAPFPGAIAGQEDPRIEAARQIVNMMNQVMPDFAVIHPTSPEEVDEECFIQHYTFKNLVTYVTYPSPSYWAWLSSQSPRGSYTFLKQALQYLQWQDGGKRGRPWILKTPVHISAVDHLIGVFPEATLVFTHRDMRQVVPSFSRLLASGRTALLNPPYSDPNVIGRGVVDDWVEQLHKHVQLREALGSRLDIYDVQYEEVKNDPISVIREIYRRAGRELTPRREQAILAWEQSHPQHHAGKYTYRIEDYGLTSEAIDSAFSDYTRRFLR